VGLGAPGGWGVKHVSHLPSNLPQAGSQGETALGILFAIFSHRFRGGLACAAPPFDAAAGRLSGQDGAGLAWKE
jgi:hypothetical protein